MSDVLWHCNDCGKTGKYPSGKSSHEGFLGHDVGWGEGETSDPETTENEQ